jgi:uncharacterized Zn-finger protein
MATKPMEKLYVTVRRITCDGSGGALGHPRVFLKMGEKNKAECPYCNQVFILRNGDTNSSVLDRHDPDGAS